MKRLLLIPLAAAIAGCATSGLDLPTESNVDLDRYAGTWYEQARLPHRFQADCTGEVRADYVLNDDRTIDVTNRCVTADGGIKVAKGQGRLAAAFDPPDPAKLEVRFAPRWTAWLPMVWGDYWIIKLERGYEYALVGTPNREYLWVLSRDRKADASEVNRLLDYARSQGFPVDKVVRTQAGQETRPALP